MSYYLSIKSNSARHESLLDGLILHNTVRLQGVQVSQCEGPEIDVIFCCVS